MFEYAFSRLLLLSFRLWLSESLASIWNVWKAGTALRGCAAAEVGLSFPAQPAENPAGGRMRSFTGGLSTTPPPAAPLLWLIHHPPEKPGGGTSFFATSFCTALEGAPGLGPVATLLSSTASHNSCTGRVDDVFSLSR